MNKNIESYVFHKKNFLNEKCCDNIINELNKCDWEKHEWYQARTDLYNKKSGDNEPEVCYAEKSRIRPDRGFYHDVMTKLHSTILEYIKNLQFDWFDGWEGYSDIRFNRYSPGQEMRNHCDHIHSLFDGERKGIPTLSILGILNDEYEGGELIMCENKKIDTKKGDLLIFPSNFLYPHKIAPVTKGVRYSYVSWVW